MNVCPIFLKDKEKQTIEAIAIAEIPECILLDVHPGKFTNRTVCIFVADPESVVEGALAAARVAGKGPALFVPEWGPK